MDLQPRSLSAVLSGAMLAVSLAVSGCDSQCGAAPPPPGAVLKLHLPPEASVTAPETVRACREPTCTEAVLPPVGAAGTLTGFNFSRPEVTGLLQRNAGDVRLLRIDWVVNDINPADPSNYYNVEIKDATDRVTGKLSDGVRYAPVEVCGNSSLRAELSD